MPSSSEFEPQTAPQIGLRVGVLKFPSVLIQGVTHIAPAVGVVLTIQFIASMAGAAAPLAYAVAFGIVLTLGISLTQLARHHPSAGGYFTYINRTVGPRAGFLTAWIYFLYDPTSTAVNLAFMGFFLQSTLASETGLVLPWWAFFIPAALGITVITYRGIEISSKTMLWLATAELTILAALSLSGILHPGSGGVNLRSFRPASAPSDSGLYLGIVFSIFSFTGFESVAPLAEETENPKRNLPRSIIWSILLTGFFFVLCSWAVLIGWGTNRIPEFVHSAENPVLSLARRLWGKAWILVFVAVANSIFGICIACTNASTRVFFAMGRANALSKSLARIHPRYQTPVNAIWLQTFITFAVGLGLGFWIGPDQEFYFMGVAMTLGLILVYVAGNYGVLRYFHGERRSEFNIWLHVFFPGVSSIALLWVGYHSLTPLPPAPLRYAPMVVALWIVTGLILVAVKPHLQTAHALSRKAPQSPEA